MEELSVVTIVSSLGLAIGVVFGAVAERSNFCTMGAISDWIFMDDKDRMRSWFLAIAVGLIGTQIMFSMEMIDLSSSIYLASNFGWAGALLGGAMFGFGMTLGGGCGNKTLVRIGAGNLKSVVVFMILGIFAYMTTRGFIGPARLELEALTVVDLSELGMETQSIPDALAVLTGMSIEILQISVTAIIAGGLIVFCFASSSFREEKHLVVAGIILGLMVPAAWYVTGVLGNDDFDPVQIEALSFVNPIGNTIIYFQTYTGATINFGIAAVGGVILGSFLSSKVRKTFHIEAFTSADDMVRNMIGGALMGVGGVLSLGCTIGQGMSGMSTLSLGSVFALAGIFFGAVFGLRYMEEGNIGDALKAVFSRD